MSGLNQAFIRAYSKESAAAGSSNASSTSAASHSSTIAQLPSSITIVASGSQTNREPASAASVRSSTSEIERSRTTLRTSNDVPGGTWYAAESVPTNRESNIPAPHLQFPSEPILVGREANVSSPAEKPAAPRVGEEKPNVTTRRIDSAELRIVPAPHFGQKRNKFRIDSPHLPGRESNRSTETDDEIASPNTAKHREPLATGSGNVSSSASLIAENSSATSFSTATETSAHEASATFANESFATEADDIDDSELPSITKLSEHREALLHSLNISRPKFQPVWEVDSFTWPDTCDKVLSSAFDLFSEASTELRKACEGGLRILAISSSQRSEGRTTVAQCLARSLATMGVRVALLDADLENPSLASSLNLEVSCGWDDAVHGELPLTEAAIYSINDRVTLLPLADDFSKRDFLLSDQRVSSTLKKLSESFDLVLVDMGPAGPAERRLFAGGAACPIHAAIVVRDMRTTSQEQAHTTAARLKANGIKSVGIIENFV